LAGIGRVVAKLKRLELFPAHAFGIAEPTGLVDKFCNFDVLDLLRNHNFIFEAIQQLLLRVDLIGGFSHYHLVQHNAEGIEIGFVGIETALNGLWSHIERRAHIAFILESKPRSNGKTEIRQFPLLPQPENVRRFDIPVQDALPQQIAIGVHELFHNLNGVGLAQFLLLIDVLIQATVGTVLHDQVVVVCCLDHLV
jgi:hypothetical protein